MCYLKFLLIPFFILTGFDGWDNAYPTRWVITKGCSFKVDGSTNINKFSCIISNLSIPDTLTFYKRTDSETASITGSLKLDISDFNCHNPVMTGDLRKTLKAKAFPQMIIRFISLSRYPESNHKTYSVNGVVSIELAGVAKKFNMIYTISPKGPNTLSLKGVREIKFSDFNIVPPRKIGGMIQTDDKLIAEFNLSLQVLN